MFMRIIRTKPLEKSLNDFIKSSSISGIFWRSSEIAAMSSLKLERPTLDLGCGEGTFASIVFDGKIDMGLDISAQAIEKAKKNNVYKIYIVADAHNIPLPDKSVNSVFSNSVFEHIFNLSRVIKEIGRILKKGGRLAFTTHAPSSKNYFGVVILKRMKLHKLADWYYKYYLLRHQLCVTWSLKKWEEELQKADLKMIVSKQIISPKIAFWYELFLPISFFQHRIPILKINLLSRALFRIIDPGYRSTYQNGRNYYIEAVKL